MEDATVIVTDTVLLRKKKIYLQLSAQDLRLTNDINTLDQAK